MVKHVHVSFFNSKREMPWFEENVHLHVVLSSSKWLFSYLEVALKLSCGSRSQLGVGCA